MIFRDQDLCTDSYFGEMISGNRNRATGKSEIGKEEKPI